MPGGVTVTVTSPLGIGTFGQFKFNIASRFIAWDAITAIGCQVNPDGITVLNNFGFTTTIGDLVFQRPGTGVQAPSAFAQSSGKYYYEIDITAFVSGNGGIVVAPPNIPYNQLTLTNPDFTQNINCPKGVLLDVSGIIYSQGNVTWVLAIRHLALLTI